MKRFILFFVSISGLVVTSFLPAKADVLDDISALLKSGNTTELSKFFAPSVDVAMPGSEGTYNKAQTEALIKDFFKKHPPLSMKVVHKLTSNASHLFSVIILSTGSGVFRTSFSVENSSGKSVITEIKFEPNKD